MTRTQAKHVADALIKLIDARVDLICRDSIRDGVYYPRKTQSAEDGNEIHRGLVQLLTNSLK